MVLLVLVLLTGFGSTMSVVSVGDMKTCEVLGQQWEGAHGLSQGQYVCLTTKEGAVIERT